MPGYGSNGEIPRPFNASAAIKQFHSWAYAAAMLNANAVASVPLRLYVRKRSGARKLFETGKVSPATRKFLRGGMEMLPSVNVMRKVAQFGGDLEEVVEMHPALQIL